MAVLTAAKRNRLQPKTFGLPRQEKYPMPDRDHAIRAKGRAKQMLAAGKLSRASYDQIITKANHKIAQG